MARGDSDLPEIGKAETLRSGSDVTLVGSLLMVQRALEVADDPEIGGIDPEIIDIRWVRPLDLSTIRKSVEKTGRLVIVEEQYHDGGWGLRSSRALLSTVRHSALHLFASVCLRYSFLTVP